MISTIYLIKMDTTEGTKNMIAYADEDKAKKALAQCKQWEAFARSKQWEVPDCTYRIEPITLIL